MRARYRCTSAWVSTRGGNFLRLSGRGIRRRSWLAKAPAPKRRSGNQTIEGCVMASGNATRRARAVQGGCPTGRPVKQRESSRRSRELRGVIQRCRRDQRSEERRVGKE